MSVSLPPTPSKTPMITQGNFVSPIWVKWFETVFLRIGGKVAPSFTDLISAERATEIEGDLTTLSASVSTNAGDITALEARIDDILQGPVL